MKLIENTLNTPCSVDGCNSLYIYRKHDWLCSYHLKMVYVKNSKTGKKNWNSGNKKPIRPVSKKRAIEMKIYSRTRKAFLDLPENKTCFIDGCASPADTIEHTAGRIGSKYLDESFWKPCCLKHNLELENNSEMSKKYQLSKHSHQKKI